MTLCHESERGGMYGHHASKAASNMVGKLLSLDLVPEEIAVRMVDPGCMRTKMTKPVGFGLVLECRGLLLRRMSQRRASVSGWMVSLI